MPDKWTVHSVCEYTYSIGIDVAGRSTRARIDLFALYGYPGQIGNAGEIRFFDKDSNIPSDTAVYSGDRGVFVMNLNVSMLHDVLELLRSSPTVQFYMGDNRRAVLSTPYFEKKAPFKVGDYKKPTKLHFDGSISQDQLKGDMLEVPPNCPQEHIPAPD